MSANARTVVTIWTYTRAPGLIGWSACTSAPPALRFTTRTAQPGRRVARVMVVRGTEKRASIRRSVSG
jgi:hypothetical protein